MAKFRGFIKQCKVCGKEFKVPPSHNHVRTCSVECGYKIRKTGKPEQVIKVCKVCGVEFSRPPSIAKNQVYCSYDCQFQDDEYKQMQSDRISGDKNPGWKGGITLTAISTTGKTYYRQPQASENARNAKRRATKLHATPAWADLAKIKKMYYACQQISEATGIPHHVDHIVPLQGELVSGLHVEYNLRIIPATENLSKANKF